jgi:hypothetical protein
MSWHLTIRSDATFSEHAATGDVIRLLAEMREDLCQTGPASFEAASGKPWVHVVIAHATASGCYASDGTPPPVTNVVELICSDFEEPEWYDTLARRIAEALRWEAVEEHADRRIWPPGESPAA